MRSNNRLMEFSDFKKFYKFEFNVTTKNHIDQDQSDPTLHGSPESLNLINSGLVQYCCRTLAINEPDYYFMITIVTRRLNYTILLWFLYNAYSV